MPFSPEWDETYRQGKQLARWPSSDVVAYFHRYARPREEFQHVLELGCGSGANIQFFQKLGLEYSAIEGSDTIVDVLHEQYPQLKDSIIVGDFTQSIPFEGPFDLVLDRGSITHNTTEAIKNTLRRTFELLRSGGMLFGFDWFSSAYPDASYGEALDSYTRTRISVGQFIGLGAVHFSDRAHVQDLLTSCGFQLDRLEHKLIEVTISAETTNLGWWNFVAVKR